MRSRKPKDGWARSTSSSAITEYFQTVHERRYAYASPDEEVELVQIRVSLIGPEKDFPKPEIRDDLSGSRLGNRDIYFTTERAFAEADIWRRDRLAPRTEITGPAVIEDQGSSILIPNNWTATIDQWLNVDIRMK